MARYGAGCVRLGLPDAAGHVHKPCIDRATGQRPNPRSRGHGDLRSSGNDYAVTHHQRTVFDNLAGRQYQSGASQGVPARRGLAQTLCRLAELLRLDRRDVDE